MKIDFSKIEEKTFQNLVGGEGETRANIFGDESNRIMYTTITPGASIGRHVHDTSSEIIYVLQGSGKMLFDDGYEELTAGLCHYCPKGHSHSFMNNGTEDLVFLAVVPEQ